jgi:peptidoglycan/LPS O-acetylase OafA/YrhL
MVKENNFDLLRLFAALQVIILSIVLGIVSWHCIEKSMLKLKKHSMFKERKK